MSWRSILLAAAAALLTTGGNTFAEERYQYPAGLFEGQFAEIEMLSEPRFAGGTITPAVGAAEGLRSLAPAPGVVVFEQRIVYRHRFRVLEQELVSPGGAYRLPKGAVLRLTYADPDSPTGRTTSWCTVDQAERACLVERTGEWTWSQEQKIGVKEQLRSIGHLLILQPTKVGPPPLKFMTAAPAFSEHTSEKMTTVAQVTLRLSAPRDASRLRIEVRGHCPSPADATTAFAGWNPPCFRGLNAPADLFDDQVFVGGDNVSARLHYNPADHSFTITRVAIDPAPGTAR